MNQQFEESFENFHIENDQMKQNEKSKEEKKPKKEKLSPEKKEDSTNYLNTMLAGAVGGAAVTGAVFVVKKLTEKPESPQPKEQKTVLDMLKDVAGIVMTVTGPIVTIFTNK